MCRHLQRIAAWSVPFSMAPLQQPKYYKSKTQWAPVVAQNVFYILSTMLQNTWTNLGSRAKKSRWVLKFGGRWRHHFLRGKGCHHFWPNFSNHLATNTKYSKSLLVRHPKIFNVYSLGFYLLSASAGVTVELQHLLQHLDMAVLLWSHYEKYKNNTWVSEVAQKSGNNFVAASLCCGMWWITCKNWMLTSAPVYSKFLSE